MKKFKTVTNIIAVLILIGGLAPCICSYAWHAMNCHGCSAHSAHPTIELMCYGVIVLFTGTVWSVSRLILRLREKKSAADLNGISPKVKSKLEMRRDILILAFLAMGFISFLLCLIFSLINSLSFDFLTLLSCIVYITPFVWAAEVVFAVSRLMKRSDKHAFGMQDSAVRAKSEKIVYILTLVILFAGFMNHMYMFVQDLQHINGTNYSVLDLFMLNSMYMIPYLVLTAAILGVKQLALSRKAKFEKRKVST